MRVQLVDDVLPQSRDTWLQRQSVSEDRFSLPRSGSENGRAGPPHEWIRPAIVEGGINH